MSKESTSLPGQPVENPKASESAYKAMPSYLSTYFACVDGACRIQSEMMDFVNKRVCEDIELPVRMARSKTPADVLQCQMDFARTMLEDYTEESRRLSELMANTSLRVGDEVDAALCDPLEKH